MNAPLPQPLPGFVLVPVPPGAFVPLINLVTLVPLAQLTSPPTPPSSLYDEDRWTWMQRYLRPQAN